MKAIEKRPCCDEPSPRARCTALLVARNGSERVSTPPASTEIPEVRTKSLSRSKQPPPTLTWGKGAPAHLPGPCVLAPAPPVAPPPQKLPRSRMTHWSSTEDLESQGSPEPRAQPTGLGKPRAVRRVRSQSQKGMVHSTGRAARVSLIGL